MARDIRVLALGVFRIEGRILVAQGTDPATGATFCRPLGGHVEFGERSEDTLRREIREELGGAIEELRLLGVLESTFEYNGSPQHEIVFVYDARFTDAAWYAREELPVVEAGTGWRAARWIAVESFASGADRLVPDGLLELLQSHAASP